MDAIRRFFTPRMGHGALTMVEKENKFLGILLNLLKVQEPWNESSDQHMSPLYGFFVGLQVGYGAMSRFCALEMDIDT
jgi:hypothetical protein